MVRDKSLGQVYMMKPRIEIEEKSKNPILKSTQKGRESNFALLEKNGSIFHVRKLTNNLKRKMASPKARSGFCRSGHNMIVKLQEE